MGNSGVHLECNSYDALYYYGNVDVWGENRDCLEKRKDSILFFHRNRVFTVTFKVRHVSVIGHCLQYARWLYGRLNLPVGFEIEREMF